MAASFGTSSNWQGKLWLLQVVKSEIQMKYWIQTFFFSRKIHYLLILIGAANLQIVL